MIRSALIIATPASPIGSLPGTNTDVRKWTEFLESPEGGAWNSSEIKVLRDPATEVAKLSLKLLQISPPDYSLLIFCGHGSHHILSDWRTEERLYLGKSEYITAAQLTTNAQKELVVVDACREVHDERVLLEEIRKMDIINSKMASFATVDRKAIARRMYDQHIAKCATGRVILHSCSLNETASDEPSFSQILITESKKIVGESPSEGILEIKDAVDAAAPLVKELETKQTPNYVAGRRITHYPIAVAIN